MLALTNVFRERSGQMAKISRGLCLVLPLLWAGLSSAISAEREALTIGIIQFPSTLNPHIDAMAAKSYVLGMALRPFTVYDADWKLVCLLCTTLLSIENGLAVPVELPEGKKGIDITYTIRPDAYWGDGVPVTTADVRFTY